MFDDPQSGLDCDICLNNLLAVHNTQLLRTYGRADPRVRPLAYLIKRWAKRRRLNNAAESTLSSYGYLLMMIHYLQSLKPPILPVLSLLPSNWDGTDEGHCEEGSADVPQVHVPSADGRPCNVWFYQPSDDKHGEALLRAYGARNKMNLAQLFVGFFHHFACKFDYQRQVVCVRKKPPIILSKEDKIQQDSWRRHRRLSIEDPFERYYDVAHPVREHKHRLIRAEMARVFALCADASVRSTSPDELLADILQERIVPVKPSPAEQPGAPKAAAGAQSATAPPQWTAQDAFPVLGARS